MKYFQYLKKLIKSSMGVELAGGRFMKNGDGSNVDGTIVSLLNLSKSGFGEEVDSDVLCSLDCVEFMLLGYFWFYNNNLMNSYNNLMSSL